MITNHSPRELLLDVDRPDSGDAVKRTEKREVYICIDDF